MRYEKDKYFHSFGRLSHPKKDRLNRNFVVDSRLSNIEQFFIFRYLLKDLIFLSGLFFVPIAPPILKNRNQNNANQIVSGVRTWHW